MTETTTYITPTETARLLRAALKESFPGVKFGVRTSKYAGGASIDVSWTDGPKQSTVDAVAKQYAGADFDGMTDMKNHRTRTAEDGSRFNYGADYVFTRREVSPEAREAAIVDLGNRSDYGVGGIRALAETGRFVDAPDVIWRAGLGHGDAPMGAWVRVWAEHLANTKEA